MPRENRFLSSFLQKSVVSEASQNKDVLFSVFASLLSEFSVGQYTKVHFYKDQTIATKQTDFLLFHGYPTKDIGQFNPYRKVSFFLPLTPFAKLQSKKSFENI